MKTVKLKIGTIQKLNDLNEKYRISEFDITSEDARNFLCELHDLHLDIKDREYIEKLLDTMILYEKEVDTITLW